MSGPQPNGHPDEQRLVKIYMDLTGKPESEARSVIMYIEGGRGQADSDSRDQTSDLMPPVKRDLSGLD